MRTPKATNYAVINRANGGWNWIARGPGGDQVKGWTRGTRKEAADEAEAIAARLVKAYQGAPEFTTTTHPGWNNRPPRYAYERQRAAGGRASNTGSASG